MTFIKNFFCVLLWAVIALLATLAIAAVWVTIGNFFGPLGTAIGGIFMLISAIAWYMTEMEKSDWKEY